MDYLEGLFLGKMWSDTDFENRRHYALFILYGLLVDIVFFLNYWTGTYQFGIGNGAIWKIIILILLCLACPFICFRYYRMPLWGKVLVLLEKLFKTLLVMDLTIGIVSPLIKVSSDGLQDYLISYLNKTLENYSDKFASSSGAFSTVMGVLAGGIHVVFVCVLALVIAVIVPGLVFIGVRIIQNGYDYVINQVILKRYLRH